MLLNESLVKNIRSDNAPIILIGFVYEIIIAFIVSLLIPYMGGTIHVIVFANAHNRYIPK